ncbi:MAG: hypothetical protein AB8I08_19185 [Sandaracinaceae bacterium]
MPRLACIRCAAVRTESRCPNCKHRTHDLDTDGGRDALSKGIRQRMTGAAMLGAGGGVALTSAFCLATALWSGDFGVGDITLAILELTLFFSTPVMIAGFALGFRFWRLWELRAPGRRRWWQHEPGPTRF